MTSQNWCPFDRTAFPSGFRATKGLSIVKMSKNDEKLTSQKWYPFDRTMFPPGFRAKKKTIITGKNDQKC